MRERERWTSIRCIALVGGLAAVGAGCSGREPVPAADPQEARHPSLEAQLEELDERQFGEVSRQLAIKRRTTLQTTANAYYAEIESQREAYGYTGRAPAAEKYHDRLIQLTGRVESLLRNPHTVSLASDEGKLVHCALDSPPDWRTIRLGQTATLEGWGEMPDWHLALKDCRIVGVTGDPPPTLSPAAFIEGVDDFREGQPVTLVGTVKRRQRWEYGTTLVLDAGENREVHCLFWTKPTDSRPVGTPGEEVEISGYVGDRLNPRMIELLSCFRIDIPPEPAVSPD